MWPSVFALGLSSLVAITLIWVRGSFTRKIYLIVSLLFFAAACAFVVYHGDIILWHSVYKFPDGVHHGFAASGISAWSIPCGILSEVAVCTLRPQRYWRILQGAMAVFLAVTWLLAGLWAT